MYFGFYVVLLKEVKCGDLRYGKNKYDYQEGTLVFLALVRWLELKQVRKYINQKVMAVVFHADFIRGTVLRTSHR